VSAGPLVLGTAGHIDHGKTWLVRALTGKDTDRLPEERERGISIDLGYAPLELPGGRRLSVVDVPGHELFIRNMVAGATGIDLFLLVIDAAEGVRAQTREHLAILRLLGVDEGVVGLTKADTVDDETLELASDEARELVPDAAVVAVSAKTGLGLDVLREALADVVERHARAPAFGATRLFVDRVFTLRGIGTVATGTLWSGSIGEGDHLRAEPGGRELRVRSVQVHDRPVERAVAGQRVAVSLPGIDRHALRRGDALVEAGAYPVSFRLDIVLEELEPIADRSRVRVHHGTAEIPAQVVRVDERFAQLRLGAPVVAARGDRVVLRAQTTLGGGRVLDPAPPRRADRDRFHLLERGGPEEIVEATVYAPVTRGELLGRGLLPAPQLDDGLRTLERAGEWFFSRRWLEDLQAEIRARLERQARTSTLDPGVPVAELVPAAPWAPAVSQLLALERRGGKGYLPGTAASLGDRADAASRLEAELAEAGANAVKVADRQLAAYLEGEGRLVRVGDGLAVSPAAYAQARRALVEECKRAGSVRLARFRDLLGISRKPAQLLLERFDADGLTRRVGDERVLRRGAAASEG
jgi:selenocysteine-specific elongation factor